MTVNQPIRQSKYTLQYITNQNTPSQNKLNASFNFTPTTKRFRTEHSIDAPRGQMTLAEENTRNNPKRSYLSFPVFSQPLRIELPYIFNTPRRVKMPITVNKIQLAFKSDLPTIKNLCGHSIGTEDRIKFQKRLKDYLLLAGACRRANKLRDEGRAYYSIGVLCDNIMNFEQAIIFYDKFLTICKAVKDTYGMLFSRRSACL